MTSSTPPAIMTPLYGRHRATVCGVVGQVGGAPRHPEHPDVVPRDRQRQHPDEPEPELRRRHAARVERPSGQLRPQRVGAGEVERSRSVPPKIRWKCAGIHIVLWTIASIAYDALTRPPNPPGISIRSARMPPSDDRLAPRQRPDPAEEALAAAQPAARLERGGDREPRQERRKGDEERAERVHQLPAGRLLRIHEHVVEADRQARRRGASRRRRGPSRRRRGIRRRPSARSCRGRRTRESARSRRSGGASTRRACARGRRRSSAARPSESRKQLEDDLDDDADHRPGPEDRAGRHAELRERDGAAGVLPLPAHRHRDRDHDPRDRPDEQERRAGVERPVRDHRRIERVEDRRACRRRSRARPGPCRRASSPKPTQARPRPPDRPADEARGRHEIAEARR